MICLDNQIRFLQSNWLKYSHHGLNQQFCLCRITLKIKISGKVSQTGKFSDRKCQKVQKFSICPEKQMFCSPKHLAAFHPPSYQSACSTCEEANDCWIMPLVFCNGNLMSQSTQNLKISSIRFDSIQTQFHSKKLSNFLPSKSQKMVFYFCSRWFKFPLLIIFLKVW